MRSLLTFFIKIGKLKTLKRRTWLLHKIRNSETNADHVFRSAILGWALNKEKELNEGELIKTILIHSLPEVLIGRKGIYNLPLPSNISRKTRNKEIQEILEQHSLFSLKGRVLISEMKEKENKAVEKITTRLPQGLKEEVRSLWNSFDKGRSKVAKFAKEITYLESLIQALEYSEKGKKVNFKTWNRWSKKNLKDPIIVKFKDSLVKSFSRKKSKKNITGDLVNFLSNLSQLKRLKRTGWILMRVKNPETVAQHTFHLAIISWFLGKMKGLDTNRIVKIALAHDLCEIYAKDQTPYDPIIFSQKKEDIFKIVSKPPRVPQKLRLEWLLKKKTKEWKGIVKITSNLPKELQEEIISLWIDFDEGSTKEGRFVQQADMLINLLQAIEYWKKDKRFPIKPWWINSKEKIDDPILLKFVEEIDRDFGKLMKKKTK